MTWVSVLRDSGRLVRNPTRVLTLRVRPTRITSVSPRNAARAGHRGGPWRRGPSTRVVRPKVGTPVSSVSTPTRTSSYFLYTYSLFLDSGVPSPSPVRLSVSPLRPVSGTDGFDRGREVVAQDGLPDCVVRSTNPVSPYYPSPSFPFWESVPRTMRSVSETTDSGSSETSYSFRSCPPYATETELRGVLATS